MTNRKYKITASIIGPYLPNSIEIDKYLIHKFDEKVPVALPTKITAKAVNEAMVVISQDVTFDSKYYVEWQIESISSKDAYEQGKVQLDSLTSALVLPASSYKYYAEIIKVEHLNETETSPDPESASSKPVHVLGYEVKNLSDVCKDYFEKLILTKDQEVEDLLQKFYTGIKSEVLSTGESNLIYYKILEEISHKTLKRLRKENREDKADYFPVLKKVENIFNKDLSDEEKLIVQEIFRSGYARQYEDYKKLLEINILELSLLSWADLLYNQSYTKKYWAFQESLK